MAIQLITGAGWRLDVARAKFAREEREDSKTSSSGCACGQDAPEYFVFVMRSGSVEKVKACSACRKRIQFEERVIKVTAMERVKRVAVYSVARHVNPLTGFSAAVEAARLEPQMPTRPRCAVEEIV